MGSPKHDLTHVSFEGRSSTRLPSRPSLDTGTANCTATHPLPDDSPDEFIVWVLGRAGLDATSYRTAPLQRRLPACLRTLQVCSTQLARELLESKPQLVAAVVSSLLIGVTEFFREPSVFEHLAARVLPELCRDDGQLRIWSAACSTGAELYSIAILLAEAGVLQQSFLLGTDCRADAITQAAAGLHDASAIRLVPSALKAVHFEPVGQRFRPVESLRARCCWRTANLLTGLESGPWNIILWRNASIYLKAATAETIWRQLAAALAPGGVIIAGKAERPPADAGLTRAGRHIYRATARLETAHAQGNISSPGGNRVGEAEREKSA